MESTSLVNLSLCCDPSAPGLARDALRQVAAIDAVRDDAVLVASELVTNAVLHSGCAAGETIELAAELHRGRVRIAVHDPGRSDGEPRSAEVPPAHGGGLGLRLVERVALRWGVERPDGRLVWAELPV